MPNNNMWDEDQDPYMQLAVAGVDNTVDTINWWNNTIEQEREAQKNRDLQLSMLNQNLEFQQSMYDQQFKNLSPATQRKLLEEAGYNPAALVANGYSAQKAAAEGGGGIGSGSMPSTTPIQSHFAQNLSTISQQQLNNSMAKKAEAEAMEKEITNQTKGLEQVQIIKNLVKQGVLTEEQANQLIIDNAIKRNAFEDIVKGYEQNTRKTQAEADAQFIQNELQKTFGATKTIAEIALLIAQGKEAAARAKAEEAGINIRQYEAATNRINAITGQRNAATNERNAFVNEWNAMTAEKAQQSQAGVNKTIETGNKINYITQMYDAIKARYDAEIQKVKANDANAMNKDQLRKLRIALEYGQKIKDILNPLNGAIQFAE